MPGLRYSDASKHDLIEIARFIAKDKPQAARQWGAKLREKCRMLAKNPEVGDDRSDLGDGIRSTYVGSYIIFFRQREERLEIVRVRRGDLESPFLGSHLECFETERLGCNNRVNESVASGV